MITEHCAVPIHSTSYGDLNLEVFKDTNGSNQQVTYKKLISSGYSLAYALVTALCYRNSEAEGIREGADE